VVPFNDMNSTAAICCRMLARGSLYTTRKLHWKESYACSFANNPK